MHPPVMQKSGRRVQAMELRLAKIELRIDQIPEAPNLDPQVAAKKLIPVPAETVLYAGFFCIIVAP